MKGPDGRSRRAWCCVNLQGSANRFERRAKLGAEQLRLLPRGEVSSLVEPVVVDELGKGLLRPASRRLVELVGERAHGDRDLDALDVEERQLALPEEPGRRDARVGQPAEGDVVEHI